tara:strand:+ start:687 stop:1112 length:426 start_codon:yes stop_codon:yes gene_type:complete
MDNLANFVEIVLRQSHKALEKSEIPIGSVIFDPSKAKIIAKAYNQELSLCDPTAHSEIICIRKACKKLKQKRLDGLSLISYLEPCDMCKEVIKSARIKSVYYLLKNHNPSRRTISNIHYKKVLYEGENLVKKFFEIRRINS